MRLKTDKKNQFIQPKLTDSAFFVNKKHRITVGEICLILIYVKNTFFTFDKTKYVVFKYQYLVYRVWLADY